MAKQTGTPVIVWEDGRVCEIRVQIELAQNLFTPRLIEDV